MIRTLLFVLIAALCRKQVLMKTSLRVPSITYREDRKEREEQGRKMVLLFACFAPFAVLLALPRRNRFVTMRMLAAGAVLFACLVAGISVRAQNAEAQGATQTLREKLKEA